MVYDHVIEGRYVVLKACTEDDAEFTLALRTDPQLGRFFPPVHNDLEQQKKWIRSQRTKAGDYFFVVWNKTGERIGTIAVYNIVDDEGEGGRIIIKSDNPFDVYESQLLLSRFAFYTLGLKAMKGFVFADNKRAIRFNKQFSGRMFSPEKDEDGREIIRLETSREEFEIIDEKLCALIYRE